MNISGTLENARKFVASKSSGAAAAVNKVRETSTTALQSYKSGYIIFFAFCCIISCIVFMVVNQNAFNNTFGYEIYPTIFFITVISILMLNLETGISGETPYGFYGVILFIALIGLICILAAAGIFSGKPPEYNSAIIVNFFIIFIFLMYGIVQSVMYVQHTNLLGKDTSKSTSTSTSTSTTTSTDTDTDTDTEPSIFSLIGLDGFKELFDSMSGVIRWLIAQSFEMYNSGVKEVGDIVKLVTLNWITLTVICLFLSLFPIAFILIYNFDEFQRMFGYEIFITIPFLIIITYLLTILTKEGSKNKEFYYYLIVLTVLIGFGGFFAVLATAGIFSDNPPQYNSALLFNLFIIFMFLVICLYLYINPNSNSKSGDENSNNKDNGSMSNKVTKWVLFFYNFFILFMLWFTCYIVVYMIYDPSSFKMSFGYEIFITIPFIILLSFLIKQCIDRTYNIYCLLVLVALIVAAGVLSMLAVGGIFSDHPPENNTAVIVNILLMFLFLVMGVCCFYYLGTKDNKKVFNKAYEFSHYLNYYTLCFVFFIMAVMLIYFLNPGGIMTNYGGPVIFFGLFVGIMLYCMITIYKYFLKNPKSKAVAGWDNGFKFLFRLLYVLGALTISGCLIYAFLYMTGIFNENKPKVTNDSSDWFFYWFHILFNLALFVTMLGIIYKLSNIGGFLDKYPAFRLVTNTVLFIPCAITYGVNYAKSKMQVVKPMTGKTSAQSMMQITSTPPKPYEMTILVVSLLLLTGYFLWVYWLYPILMNKYITQGGNQLINQPVVTTKETDVSTYDSLTGNEDPDYRNYRYALSLWIYLDTFKHSKQMSSLLSFGNNPGISYNSVNNTLYVTTNLDVEYVDINSKTSEVIRTHPDEFKRVIYEEKDFKLQKWNNVVLNYDGGTLDVFINGKLMTSAIDVISYIEKDTLTIGDENGVPGFIANLIYFKNPLDLLTIQSLYNSVKNKSPPVTI